MIAEGSSPDLGLQPCLCLVTPGGRRSRGCPCGQQVCSGVAEQTTGTIQIPRWGCFPHPSPNKTLASAAPSSKQRLHHQLLRKGSLGASAFGRVFMPAKRLFKSSPLRSQPAGSCTTCSYCLCTTVLIHKQSQRLTRKYYFTYQTMV